jgi:hypothetical protein
MQRRNFLKVFSVAPMIPLVRGGKKIYRGIRLLALNQWIKWHDEWMIIRPSAVKNIPKEMNITENSFDDYNPDSIGRCFNFRIDESYYLIADVEVDRSYEKSTPSIWIVFYDERYMNTSGAVDVEIMDRFGFRLTESGNVDKNIKTLKEQERVNNYVKV